MSSTAAQTTQDKLNVAQFLAWYKTQPGDRRYELVDGEPIAMSAERVRHADTKLTIAIALREAIKTAGLECHTLPDGMTVVIDEYTSYEPDALVYCGEKLDGDEVIVPEPVIIVEVMSPRTSNIDTGAKFEGYMSLASLRHYLIVNATEATIIHHRKDNDGQIISTIVKSGQFNLSPPGLALRCKEFFDSST